MQNYKFKNNKLPPADELWLKEIYNTKFGELNRNATRVRLKNVLPRDYKPENIDGRYIKNDRLTLLGIWYVEHNSQIIPKVEIVIKEIQSLICGDSTPNNFQSDFISKNTILREEEVKFIFRIILDLELLSGSRMNPGEVNPCEVSFSDNHRGFGRVLYFKDIYETMEEYFIEKTPRGYLSATPSNKKESKSAPIEKLDIFVDLKRIQELEQITNDSYDLRRLIELCKELNYANEKKSYLAIAMITRTIINHVPPIFNSKKFSEVANNYNGGKSFKELMLRLDNSLKNIAGNHLHKQISSSEVLPNFTQVNFAPELDMLLSEIISILRKGTH